MATDDEIKQSIGCLSTVFPQFIAKELANLTDQIFAGVQGFTDPLQAIADLNLTNLLDDVGTLSGGDVFDDMSAVAGGLLTQYTQRELDDSLREIREDYPGATKAVQKMANYSSQIIQSGMLMMSLYKDMPYAAAQRMGEMIIRLVDLKIKNLKCLQRHVVQLVNAILVLAKNVETYKDDTFSELDDASEFLATVKLELINSRRLSGGVVSFDVEAFERAREAMLRVTNKLTPDQDGTSIMDVAAILTFGSVDEAHYSLSNRALTTLVIPSLVNLMEVEIGAVNTQISVINFYIEKMAGVIQSFQNAANTSRVAEQRSRAIVDIQVRVENLCERIDLSRARKNLRAAQAEMLLWSSRAKAIIVLMDRVKQLAFKEGSLEGDDAAFAIEEAFQQLLTDLTSISNNATVLGIEDPTLLTGKVLALTSGARRISKDLDDGRANPNDMATFHALAVTSATSQVSDIEASITVAQDQRAACVRFNEIEIAVTPQLNQLVDSLRQLGLDRGVDLIDTGSFEEFLDADLDTLSYLGIAIKCLKDALSGIDDVQTRQQITDIRDNLIGEETNLRIAAVDSAASGLTRFIDTTKEKIASIQKSAKTVEAIVAQLEELGTQIGLNIDEAKAGYNAFRGNLAQLDVGAGGRLAAGLEEFSDHPNGGVVLCD
jgi:hypothetical protein